MTLTAGISISLTGRYARQGIHAFRGAQLWAEQAGAQLVFYDDASFGARVEENVRRLIDRDRVAVLFGPYSSGLALRAAKIAEQHRRVLWNHGGSSDDVAGPSLVSTPAPASRYFRGLPPWLLRNAPGARSITALCASRGSFAPNVLRGLAEEAAACGLSLTRLPIEGAPAPKAEVLVLIGDFEQEVAVIRTRPEARIIAAVAAGSHAFASALGPLAEGVLGPSQWEPGPESEWFVGSFQKRFGEQPEYTAAGAYATGLVIEECIRRTGEVSDRRLREAAAALDFHSFYGRFRIDPDTGRQTGHEVLLVRWHGGRKVVVG